MSPLSLNGVEMRRKLDSMPSSGPLHLLLATFARWSDDAARFAAAIAFHTVLALSGLTVLAYALAGAGAALTGDAIVARLTQAFLSESDSLRLQALVAFASRHRPGLSAMGLALVAALGGMAGGVAQWRQAFASLVRSAPLPRGHAHQGRKHAAGLALMLALALAVLASIGIGAALTSLGKYTALRDVGGPQALGMFHLTLAFSVPAVVLAALFRWLPPRLALSWQAAWMAGALGAVVLGVGTCVAGRYLVHVDVTSLDGLVHAGLVGMIGMYAAAQVLLFAAALAVVLHEANILRASALAAPKPVAPLTQNLAKQTTAAPPINAVRPGRPGTATGPHGRRPGPIASPGKSAVILKFPGKKTKRP